jgi:hypothetical protein
VSILPRSQSDAIEKAVPHRLSRFLLTFPRGLCEAVHSQCLQSSLMT